MEQTNEDDQSTADVGNFVEQDLSGINMEELEQEVILQEATIATLAAKLDSIDTSIAEENLSIKQRTSKLQKLQARKVELTESHERNTKLVQEIESNLRKCLETLKKKMNDMQKERITQVNQNQEQTEEQHTSSADPLPPPTDDLQKSTERNFKKPEIKDESSSQARRQTDHKKLVTRPRSEQLRIRIKVKKFHQDIEAIFRASFSEHMESTSSVAIDNELERRCHVRTLCPSMTTAVLERLLMSHYEEILLIVKQKGKKTRKSLDRHREMHSQGTYAQDIYVQGSCLDLYACLYEWHSPGKRFALPWEKGEMKSTQQKKTKKEEKETNFSF